MTTSRDEQKRKPKAGARLGGYVLTGLLVAGLLGGYGATGFSSQVSSIGSVGSSKISTNDYARALQAKANQYSQQSGMAISVQQLIDRGIGGQVVAELLQQATLADQADKLGISVGDQTVAAELLKQNAFIGASGAFDSKIYRDTLKQNGWSVSEYEEKLREDAARSLLSGAIAGGQTVPATIVEKIMAFQGETRDFAILELVKSDLNALPAEPSEDELKAWYEANIARFTLPESKRIKYAALLPEVEAAKYPVDEAKLRAIYDERISEYVVAERRLLDRLIYPDEAARDAALASGKSFEDLVAERELTLDAVDFGDVEEKALGADGAAIFAAEDGAMVAGETDLGPAIYRINGRLEGHETPFEAAKAELSADLMQDAARRAIADQVDQIDDYLAGGETIDGLANLMNMTKGTVDYAASRKIDDVIAGYAAFRAEADKIKAGDFPQAILLEDGGVVALEFVETIPPAPIPFEEARDEVYEALTKERLTAAFAERAKEIKALVEAGTPLGTQGVVSNVRSFHRNATRAKAPDTLADEIFALQEGEVKIIESGDYIAVVQLGAIHAADPEDPENAATRDALTAALRGSLSQDALAAYLAAAGQKSGISLDQNAINLVNTSLK